MNQIKLSVIIPCYNEEEVIGETCNRLNQVMADNDFKDYELLFVDDGSQDETLRILSQVSARDKQVKVISFSRNFGHQNAVTAGIKNCQGDIAVIIDADLQDPPELIPEMINKWRDEDCNVVYAVRTERHGESLFKRITAKIYYRIINFFSETQLPLDTGDFRLIDRKIIEVFKKIDEKNKYIRGLISWIGFKQIPIYYERSPRFAGVTKYPLMKMLKFATTGLLYFTKKPLKLGLNLGVISIIISLVLTVYCLIARLFEPTQMIERWALFISLLFMGGVQLLTVGIIGEYIGGIFDEVKGRPEYIIDEMINFDHLFEEGTKE